jgi:hypothetical protein
MARSPEALRPEGYALPDRPRPVGAGGLEAERGALLATVDRVDSQQMEIAGRSVLVAAIVADGLEVARPERDKGIDLLAFSVDPWKVVPIQMKAAAHESFAVHHKYALVPGLVMAYVWHAATPGESVVYAMPYRKAVDVAEQLGWTKTKSWQEAGGYSTTRPSAKVKAVLEPFKMGDGDWATLVEHV